MMFGHNLRLPYIQIALLQNGEDYFPAIEAAQDRAVHEIYLVLIRKINNIRFSNS
jgi:hypothetical protein